MITFSESQALAQTSANRYVGRSPFVDGAVVTVLSRTAVEAKDENGADVEVDDNKMWMHVLKVSVQKGDGPARQTFLFPSMAWKEKVGKDNAIHANGGRMLTKIKEMAESGQYASDLQLLDAVVQWAQGQSFTVARHAFAASSEKDGKVRTYSSATLDI